MANPGDSSPGPEEGRGMGAERERERDDRWEMGEGHLIFNRLRHKCNMIHSEQATWIRWKLIKTIPHFSAFKTS